MVDQNVENIGDKTEKKKKLRGMNSGLYFFQTNQHLCLFFKPKKEKIRNVFGGKHKNLREKKKGFVLVLLLCRQILLVERTVIPFSY